MPRKLITRNHAITAVLCFLLLSPGDVYRVVLGEHDLSVQEGTEQIRDVLRIVVHPNWNIDCVACGLAHCFTSRINMAYA